MGARHPFLQRYHGSLPGEAIRMPIGRRKVAILDDRAMVKLLFALVLAATLCDPAGAVPLPRPRPHQAPAAPQPQPSETEEPARPSACRLRLTAALAVA